MSKANVPLIAITPDEGPLYDYDITNNIDEVATDVEDIYFQTEKRKKKSRKQAPKIDAYATDLEDVEGSDDDTTTPIIKHTEPMSWNDMIDEEMPMVEEFYKTSDKNGRKKPKLKTQASITTNSQQRLQITDDESYQVLTDLEDFNDSDEEDEVSEIETSDTDLLKEILHDSGTVAISDSVKKFLQAVPSPIATPVDYLSENDNDKQCSNSKSLSVKNKYTKHHISPISISPHLSDLTDTEVVQCDSNDDVKKNKQKHKYGKGRRHTLPPKAKLDTTDSEDLDVSENEQTKNMRRVTVSDISSIEKLKLESTPSCSKKENVTSMHLGIAPSLHDLESDDDRITILYPEKKKKKRSDHLLQIDKETDAGLTDTEDIGEFIPDEIQYPCDENTLNYVENFDTNNGIIEEKVNDKESKKLFKMEESRVIKKRYKENIDQNETDEEEDEELEAEMNKGYTQNKNPKNITIKFIKKKKSDYSKKVQTTKKQTPTINLCLPDDENESALTDVENLNSSDDDSIEKTEIPITVVDDMYAHHTDSESVDGDFDNKILEVIPDNYIPPCQRNMIHETETINNDLLIVSTTIPDTKETITNETDFIHTDNEDFSCEEFEPELDLGEKFVLELDFVDDEKVEHKSILKLPKKSVKDEGDTDVEDIDTLKKPKVHKRSRRFLQVTNNDDTDKLTDVEDLEFSDPEKISDYNYLQVDENSSNVKTDVEDFDASDNENDKPDIEYSQTPDILRQMGGETICTQEGIGSFSKQDRNKLNDKHRPTNVSTVSPSPTFTDEIITSADDENYSRAETATPVQMTEALDEASSFKIHSQSSQKLNLEAEDEVIYLKGGGFLPDSITDTEELGISDEEYFLANDKNEMFMSNKIWLQFGNDQNQLEFKMLSDLQNYGTLLQGCFSHEEVNKEWGPAKGTSSAGEKPGAEPVIVRDAALKEQPAATSSTFSGAAAASLLRDEGASDEKQETSESNQGTPQHRGFADQHQLSSEMKELLEEMEKQTKH